MTATIPERLPEHVQAEHDTELKARQRRLREVIDSVFIDTALLEDIGVLPANDENDELTA